MRRLRPIPIFLAIASVAQAQSLPSVNVRGTVIDAATSLPLDGVRLTLTGMAPSVLPASSPSPILPGSRVAVTDSSGSYEIMGVAAGEYRLFVRRLGYQPVLIDLDASKPSTDARLSFGLVVVPIRLDAIRIDGARSNLFGRLSLNEDTNSVVSGPAAARARQAEFLGTDVREITRASALDAGGFGEADVFRALQRLPGVTGPAAQAAELWVRGARWDQVRISYDGMPLFNPFHARGVITGIASDAIGAAFLHPGVRPVSLLAQGPSLIDLRSRAATDSSGPWAVNASLRGVALAHESFRPGKGGLAFTALRSTGDLIDLPYQLKQDDGGYSDLALRYDRILSGNRSLEVTALRTRDASDFLAQAGGFALPISLGSLLGRVTLNTSTARFRIAHTVGFSSYRATDVSGLYPMGVIDTTTTFLLFTVPGGYFTRQASVGYQSYRTDIEPLVNSGRRWQGGYQLFRYQTSSFGLHHSMSWSDLTTDPFDVRGGRSFGAIWAERRWTPTSALTLNTGARLETSLDAFGGRFAPSVQARYRLDGTTNLSIGASRVFQDAQQLPFTSQTGAADRGLWLLSGSGIPVMRADQASVGFDRWIGESILFDVNAYARRLRDVLVRPLPAGDSVPRPVFLASDVDATGLEVGLRKLAGRVTGSLGYTWGRSTQEVGGESFTAAGDRTHSVDAVAALRINQKHRLGSAFTFMSGAPYTRTFIGRGILVAPDTVHWSSLSRAEKRNAERLPDYASLDLFWERSWKRNTMVFAVQNVLDRENYTVSYATVDGAGFQEGSGMRHDAGGNTLIAPTGRKYNLTLRFTF